MSMIIAVATGKGGVTKTTTSVNIAAMAATTGKSVIVVDTDMNKPDASYWSSVRDEYGHLPKLTCVSKTGKIGYELTKFKSVYDLIIVDCAGADSVEMRQAVAVSDLVVVPLQPGQFDIWAVSAIEKVIKEMSQKMDRQINAYTLLTRVHSNPGVRETQEAIESLKEYETTLPMMRSMICNRVSYNRANKQGLGVIELKGAEKDNAANVELINLYQEIFNEKYQAGE
jgi:chromosome partitioning protein